MDSRSTSNSNDDSIRQQQQRDVGDMDRMKTVMEDGGLVRGRATEGVDDAGQQQQEEIDVTDIDDDGGNGTRNDDDVILKQILEESLADHGQKNHSVEYDKKTGRVIELAIGTTLTAPFDHHWNLSPSIQHLHALRRLSVTSCRSLPEEIGMLKHLRSLTLIVCKRMENLPLVFSNSRLISNQQQHQQWQDREDNSKTQQQQKKRDISLEEFRILGIIPMIPPFLLSRLSGLSKLRVLQYSFHALSRDEELEYARALDSSQNMFMTNSKKQKNGGDDDGSDNTDTDTESFPCHIHYAFEPTLQELILNRCHLSTRSMEILVKDVAPKYPSLRILSLCKNNIKSLNGLVADVTRRRDTQHLEASGGRAKAEAMASAFNVESSATRLEELILSDNPVWHGPLPSFISPYEDSGDENENHDNNEDIRRERQSLTPSEVRRRHDDEKEQMLQKAKQEQTNLEVFLAKQAPRMAYLGFRFEKSKLWTPIVQHWLDVNKCGRRLLNANQEDEKSSLCASYVNGIGCRVEKTALKYDEREDTRTGEGYEYLSLWPLVFDRTFVHFSKADTIFGTLGGHIQCRMTAEMRAANVAYYLLRNGPVLEDRKEGVVGDS